MIDIVVAFLGFVLIAVALQDAFEVVLLPRRVERRVRFMHYFFRSTWAVWSRLGKLLPAGIRREGLLGIYGPLSMVLLFGCWGISIIIGFGFLQWTLQAKAVLATSPTLASQLYLSGETFFTLGYESLAFRTDLSHILIIIEAGTGFGFIALMVSYLPVLYHDFSQRDAQIIQLDARAGSPPTAGTLLQRQATLGDLDTLNEWLRDWEVWASELIESHSSYPMLAFYRSQHQNQSWLASLAVMLDCCTLIISSVEDISLLQAGSTFAAARRVLIEISRSLNVTPRVRVGMDRFSPEALAEIKHILVTAGWRCSAGVEVAEMMTSLRASYEPMLEGISSYLVLPLPTCTPNGHASVCVGQRASLVGRLTQGKDSSTKFN